MMSASAMHIIQTDAMYEIIWQVKVHEQLQVLFEQRCAMPQVTTHITVILEEGAQLDLIPLIMGGDVSELHISLMLAQNAHATIKGAYALNNHQKSMVRIKQHHQGAASISHVTINGVAADYASVDYAGIIRIDEHALKSIASQENKTILWSDTAKAQSIPSLEVKTNDVNCAHGSAIGPINKEHIWYAQSRGMNAAQAQRMLVKSFFSQTLPDSINTTLIDELTKKVIDQGLV